MKKIILLTFIFTPMLTFAAPASNIAWTTQQLNFVKKGNLNRGKQLAKNCTTCHGEKGISEIAMYPNLAGQLATYLFKQLRDYKDGSLQSPMMAAFTQDLSKQDTADLAAWFSSLPRAQNKITKTTHQADQLVFKGDGKRLIPPCFTCHGSTGLGEKMSIPALAGQKTDYFIETLKAYRNGDRHNDIYSRMRLISQHLTDQEIENLAEYYKQLQ